MLSRVARQKNAVFPMRKTSAYRALGASSSLRLHASLSRPGLFTSSSNSSPSESRCRPSFPSQRHLATAADPSTLEQGSNPLSLDESWHSAMDNSSFGPANSFDSSSLVIVDDTPQTKPIYVQKRNGLGGDPTDVLAYFNMSLKVGKLDRAAALIRRLGKYYPTEGPEYMSLHNRYLLAVVQQAIITRQQDMAFSLQKWFEVDMPASGVKSDATTLAAMIRLVLRMFHGSKRDRCVRRYWDIAKTADLHEELLTVEVLTDLDLGELSRVSPQIAQCLSFSY